MRSVRTLAVHVVLLMVTIDNGRYVVPPVSPGARLVDSVWTLLDEKYIDVAYNGHSASAIRKQFLDVTYSSDAEDRNAARRMLDLLGDPLTRLMDPVDFASMVKESNGQTATVGLADPWTLRDESTGALKVLHVIAGSPAFHMGVQPGDRIEGIDGAPTRSMSRDQAFTRLAGEPGTVVRLTIRRGAKRHRVAVTRELLEPHAVTASMVTEQGKQLGYLALSQFGRDSAQQVRSALADLLKSNVQGIVLDLRNNPGGFVTASREIAGLFLPGKRVLYRLIDRTGVAKNLESTGTQLTAKPMVVIVNGATTSAAEMLAGALQDNKRATLVGSQTFGQGLIHSVQPLRDGFALVIAVARFATPLGNDILRQGIKPDISVASSEIGDPRGSESAPNDQYQRAADVLVAEIAKPDEQIR